jgi:hypothetical protein
LFEINQLKNKELIVYNIPKNSSIHLINGKNNYIISEVKIDEDEKQYFPGFNTARKLGLNYPVFLISSDTFTNGEIFLKNGFVFFEGKTISIRKNPGVANENRLPDFIINPTDLKQYQHLKNLQTTIITNKRFIEKNEFSGGEIHFINTNGAFRKKW